MIEAFLLQRIFKLFLRHTIVKDNSVLPEEEYILARGTGPDKEKNYQSICTNQSSGIVQAQYAMRFMRMPFRDFTSVFLNKNVDDVTCEDMRALSEWNKEPIYLETKDVPNYISNIKEIKETFFANYHIQKLNGTNPKIIDAIDEEVAHNDLLDQSPSFVITNALSVYYRMCSCYLSVKRWKQKHITKNEIQVTQAMLNSYFIRTLILRRTYPIIEAAYHYHDDFEVLESSYETAVISLCREFLDIENSLIKKGTSPENISYLMGLLHKTMLSFPYLYVICKKSKIDIDQFLPYFKKYEVVNDKLIQNVKNIILSEQYSSDSLKNYLLDQKKRRTTNSQLDVDFIPSIAYLSTETRIGFIPLDLISYTLWQPNMWKYGWVILKGRFSNSKTNDNEKLVDFPSINSYGLNDEKFNVDLQMKMFENSKYFFNGSLGLEADLTGNEGMKGMINAKSCHHLLIQTIFVKAFYAAKVWEHLTIDDFIGRFDLSFSARPVVEPIKELIQKTILPKFYAEAQEIDYCYPDKFSINVVLSFQHKIMELHDYIETTLNNDERDRFYRFCDANYLHGF